MSDLVPLATFARRHWPSCRRWPHDRLLAWLEWYRHGSKIAVACDGKKIVGLGLARILDQLDKRTDFYAHVENGRIIWIDLAIAQHPRALRALWQAMVRRYGPRDRVAFHRSKSEWLRPRLYDFSKLNQRLQFKKG